LGLRYCWGLRTFTIRLDVMLPDFDTLPAGHHGGIYANAFRILRWLPKGCKVILEGNVNESVKRVVAEEGRLLVELDEARLCFFLFCLLGCTEHQS
jgi:epsin